MFSFKKWIAWFKYKKAMKRAEKYLTDCMELYERNNQLIEEAKILIEAEKIEEGQFNG